MPKKNLPVSALTLNSRFRAIVDKFHAKWPGKKPKELRPARCVGMVVFASLEENLSAFEFLCRQTYSGPIVLQEPRSSVEDWLHTFLLYPDFTVALMAKCRKEVRKYDALDRLLFRLSATGALAHTGDPEIHLDLRRIDPDRPWSLEQVTKRRERWTETENAGRAETAKVESEALDNLPKWQNASDKK